MEVREFAERILFSCDLRDKLLTVDDFSDLQPFRSRELPLLPGRPAALSLSRWHSEKRVSFPTRSELLDPVKVGVLLHFFANHELLALELMALALLKFPDAPSAFRLGVVRTMQDEQRHLTAYLEQMKSVGVELGDIPVNDFFWSQCASMKTPLDYVSRMSLTFEQANLDFASYFRDVLTDIGDLKTATLMQTVLDDEIGHVKHGLVWFRRWKRDSQSDWAAFCEALGAEVNPARAKGNVFRTDCRLRAGLDLEFIHSLKIFSQSKGGLPRVSLYNPDAEEEIRTNGSRKQLPAAVQSLSQDLAPVMMFALNQDDILLLPRALPNNFLLELSEVGIEIPELMVSELDETSILKSTQSRRISGVHPWAVTPWTQSIERSLQIESGSGSSSTADLRTLYSKATALEILKAFLEKSGADERLVPMFAVGEVVTSPAQFSDLMKRLMSFGFTGQFIAKRPWSASGRHRIMSSIDERPWVEQPVEVQRWFEKSWRLGEVPIVQPLFKRIVDVSVQGRIDPGGSLPTVHLLGQTRVLNLSNGQYAGSCVGRFMSGLDEACLRFWHDRGSAEVGGVDELLNRAARFVGEQLIGRGYSGPFGIDAFVYEDNEGSYKVFPIIEINPRHTMGRISLSLAKRMSPGRVGCWFHIPAHWLSRLHVNSFVELREKWRVILPLKTFSKSGGTLVMSGLLETTPAEQCSSLWTCFVVGRDHAEMSEQLGLAELM